MKFDKPIQDGLKNGKITQKKKKKFSTIFAQMSEIIHSAMVGGRPWSVIISGEESPKRNGMDGVGDPSGQRRVLDRCSRQINGRPTVHL